MTMAIAFYEHGTNPDVAVGPGTAGALARLGVTSVNILADSTGVAVVMEGWAFDPRSAEQAAAAAARGTGGRPRILYPLSDISVRPVDRKGVPT